MKESQPPLSGEFGFLTENQKAVLDLLANHHSSKEIAFLLGISETSVNRRLEKVKLRLGGVPRTELARRYRLWLEAHPALEAAEPPEKSHLEGVESTPQILQLAGAGKAGEQEDRDSDVRETLFEDSVAMSIEAPWKGWSEPRIVPRVLDGDNATLTRGATIAILLFAIVASIVVGLAAAKALADAVS